MLAFLSDADSSQLATLAVAALPSALPVAAALWLPAVAHDLAHLAAARAYNVTLGMPLPLPSADLGYFGTHAPLASFPPNRTALADVALAGPLTGIALSALFLFVGLGLTAAAPAATLDTFPRLSLGIVHSSLLPSLLVEATSRLASLSRGIPLDLGSPLDLWGHLDLGLGSQLGLGSHLGSQLGGQLGGQLAGTAATAGMATGGAAITGAAGGAVATGVVAGVATTGTTGAAVGVAAAASSLAGNIHM